MKQYLMFLLIVLLGFIMSGCTPVTPAVTALTPTVANTLIPIFSPTPAFTATPAFTPTPAVTATLAPTPTLTPVPEVVTAVAAAESHTCVLTNLGTVRCWGSDQFGQLGDGLNAVRGIPVVVAGLESNIVAINANYTGTCVLSGSGSVACWGSGRGKPGSSDSGEVPAVVAGLTDIKSVAVGGSFTCALTKTGAVKCWGANDYGQIGDAAHSGSDIPVDVPGIDTPGTAIAAGGRHACVLTSSGGVKCWGYNEYGQLGNGSPWVEYKPIDVKGLGSGVAAIAAGYGHTCALTTSGGVKCWGLNKYGELGNGTLQNSEYPVDITGLSSGVTAISAGETHTCVLTSAGAVKCWGMNRNYQLGDGTDKDSAVPVDVTGLSGGIAAISAGADSTCALTNAGQVKCWGIHYQALPEGNASQTPVDMLGLTAGGAPMTINHDGSWQGTGNTSLISFTVKNNRFTGIMVEIAMPDCQNSYFHVSGKPDAAIGDDGSFSMTLQTTAGDITVSGQFTEDYKVKGTIQANSFQCGKAYDGFVAH